jgi:transposase
MRYELTDLEWSAIKPFLPNKPRGVPRVNDRRVLNGIFWVLRSGAPWRDLPRAFGPYTTCYNRFVRWRRAGVWDQIMNALAAGRDAAVQVVDTSDRYLRRACPPACSLYRRQLLSGYTFLVDVNLWQTTLHLFTIAGAIYVYIFARSQTDNSRLHEG